ncbi:hypothetical protein [Brevundimonas sp.]|uniref:hypothetical protein n=1 Tax=Brevundimonas sp. TaxID=1871086 RepID=UPI0028A016C9|nr:hypothetical protein [Brevundimonas sp.]
MAKLQVLGTTLLLCSVIVDAAFAQGAAPITDRDVVGAWTLAITPADRQDVSITFKAKDGRQQLDFPLTVTALASGRLSCVVDGDPAECRVRDGRLIVVVAENGVRMTFTLAERTRTGFRGDASLRVRLLPIGGPIGVVNMARR